MDTENTNQRTDSFPPGAGFQRRLETATDQTHQHYCQLLYSHLKKNKTLNLLMIINHAFSCFNETFWRSAATSSAGILGKRYRTWSKTNAITATGPLHYSSWQETVSQESARAKKLLCTSVDHQIQRFIKLLHQIKSCGI